MTVNTHVELARRLLINVEAETCDQADAPMKVPAAVYRDPQRWEQEMQRVFHRSPLTVAMSCDLREPGDYKALEIAGRPVVVVRGDDGVARTFLNVCRHRGAQVTEEGCGHLRRLVCPYHAWSYDTRGSLVSVPGRDTFGDLDVTGLVELTTHERHGLVLAMLTPDLDFDPDEWLGEMGDALAMMHLDQFHRYDVTSVVEGPNWKIAADGYVDGYHIGYLHRSTIGTRSITNRNTYDLFAPHVRIGFATKVTPTLRDLPDDQWRLPDAMSLVHFIFPNISISGHATTAIQVSTLLPGPTNDRSRTIQTHYFRSPIEGDDAIAKAEERRQLYERVVRDEDYATGFKIGRALDAFGDGHFRFGRNEPGNQLFHRTIDSLVGGGVAAGVR
jgi:phenylpropionate dioxygenase-like ring-hydroxylating dioxygenase large terminal subunit